MSVLYKESRIAYTGAVRRVALDPLLMDGVQVTELGGGEHVRFVVLNEDGTVLQAETDAEYEQIYTTPHGLAVLAWSGELAVGLEVQTIKVVWDVAVGAATDRWADAIDVVASPFADRALVITADGVLV